MVILVICFAAPLIVAPLIVLACRHLFATFVQEGASLFVNMDIHRPWAMTLATPIAIGNALVFVVAWWAALGLSAAGEGNFVLTIPFIFALGIGFLLTYIVLKERLNLPSGSAFVVGLLVFAGGNLPVLLILPVLLMLAATIEPPIPVQE